MLAAVSRRKPKQAEARANRTRPSWPTTKLADGGFVTAPGSEVYNPLSGEWEPENVGVAPDIEVEQDPALVRQGRDPQLEKQSKWWWRN